MWSEKQRMGYHVWVFSPKFCTNTADIYITRMGYHYRQNSAQNRRSVLPGHFMYIGYYFCLSVAIYKKGTIKCIRNENFITHCPDSSIVALNPRCWPNCLYVLPSSCSHPSFQPPSPLPYKRATVAADCFVPVYQFCWMLSKQAIKYIPQAVWLLSFDLRKVTGGNCNELKLLKKHRQLNFSYCIF